MLVVRRCLPGLAPAPAALLSTLGSTLVLLSAAAFEACAPYWLADACSGRWAWPLAAAVSLLLWSLASEQLPGSSANLQFVALLLALSAGARALGRPLRAARLGAASLALDRYAIATLAGAHPRRRDWSRHSYVLLHAVSAPAAATLPRLLGDGLRQVW